MTVNEYFTYLLGLVGKREYSILLRELYKMDFYAMIPNDDNRAADGLMIRDDFIFERGHHALSYFQNRPCSVLEMLIALAQRLEFEVMSTEFEKTTKEWFWILVDNLRLSRMTNDRISEYPKVLDQIQTTISCFLSRSYDSNGDGGLFPLHAPRQDQRGIEIWYQMSAYILENYPIV